MTFPKETTKLKITKKTKTTDKCCNKKMFINEKVKSKMTKTEFKDNSNDRGNWTYSLVNYFLSYIIDPSDTHLRLSQPLTFNHKNLSMFVSNSFS